MPLEGAKPIFDGSVRYLPEANPQQQEHGKDGDLQLTFLCNIVGVRHHSCPIRNNTDKELHLQSDKREACSLGIANVMSEKGDAKSCVLMRPRLAILPDFRLRIQ